MELFRIVRKCGSQQARKQALAFKDPAEKVFGMEIFGVCCKPGTCLVNMIMVAAQLRSVQKRKSRGGS